jgi:hypothetical protein
MSQVSKEAPHEVVAVCWRIHSKVGINYCYLGKMNKKAASHAHIEDSYPCPLHSDGKIGRKYSFESYKVEVLAYLSSIWLYIYVGPNTICFMFLFMKSQAQQENLLLAFSTKHQFRRRIFFSIIFGEGRCTERSLLDVNFRFALSAFHSRNCGK